MSFERSNSSESGDHGFVQDLNGAIRENPLAAGLIGMGALWMLFGGSKASALGGKMSGAAKSVAGAVGAVAEAGGAAGSRMANAARQAGDSVSFGAQGVATLFRETLAAGDGAVPSETASGTVGQAANAVKEAIQTSAQSGMELGTSLQKNLKKSLERQPLLLGAIGLAIGAGIASAFPSTKFESEYMGEAGAAAKDKLEQFASEAGDLVTTRAKQVLDDVKLEAEARGLTPSGVKEALKGVSEKVRTVAGSTRESLKERLS